MARQMPDHISTNIVIWAEAVKHLTSLSNRFFRLAAKAPTEFQRGQLSGRGEMCDELKNLPQALALLAEEDIREKDRTANVKGQTRPGE